MDIHKPKPWHGLREFLKEYLIIVVGVLTALVAEQVVETLHWRHVVEAEDQALEHEVTRNYAAMLVRVILQPCIDARLAELDTVFRHHDAGEPIGLIAPIGRPTTFSGYKTTLSMATSDQSLSHMPLARKEAIFATYGSFDTFAPVAAEERASWRSLQALDHPATLDQSDWRELRRAFDAVRDNNATMKANLRSDGLPHWLTAYAAFKKPDIAALTRQVNGYPNVKQLCEPALKD